MMRRLLAGFIFFFSLSLHATQRDNLSAWLVDSLVKVFPNSPAVTSKSELALVSARNAHISLQLALRSESRRVIRVRFIAPSVGHAALKVQTYRIGNVTVNSHPTDTPLDEVVRSEVGPYPDPLFPLKKEIRLEASRTETVWVSVFAPADARPGIYRAAVDIDAGKQTLTLPSTTELSTPPLPTA